MEENIIRKKMFFVGAIAIAVTLTIVFWKILITTATTKKEEKWVDAATKMIVESKSAWAALGYENLPDTIKVSDK